MTGCGSLCVLVYPKLRLEFVKKIFCNNENNKNLKLSKKNFRSLVGHPYYF